MNWKDYTSQKPHLGARFIYAHSDGCSTGMAIMLTGGPIDAEDGSLVAEGLKDWWQGAIWAELPPTYALAIEAD